MFHPQPPLPAHQHHCLRRAGTTACSPAPLPARRHHCLLTGTTACRASCASASWTSSRTPCARPSSASWGGCSQCQCSLHAPRVTWIPTSVWGCPSVCDRISFLLFPLSGAGRRPMHLRVHVSPATCFPSGGWGLPLLLRACGGLLLTEAAVDLGLDARLRYPPACWSAALL